MSGKIRTDITMKKTALAGLAAFIVLAIIGSTFFGASWAQAHIDTPTITQAQTTITRTDNFTLTSTTTTVSYLVSTSTQVQLSTATYIGPDTVKVSGTASSAGIGTTAEEILFINSETNQNFTSPISGGGYSITLNNHATYTVRIAYTTVAGGLGSGSCIAAGLVLYYTGDSLSANWRC